MLLNKSFGVKARPSLHVRHVLLVLVADILVDLFTRSEVPADTHLPGLRERAGVFDGHFLFQATQIRPRIALDHVQFFGVRIHANPTPLIEADRIDNQSVRLPAADGITHPAREWIARMAASVRSEEHTSELQSHVKL